MAQLEWRRGVRRALVAAFMVGALAACGNDLPVFTGQGPSYAPGGNYDCCVDGVYYTCQSKLAYGQCLQTPSDTSQCTLQLGRSCPPTSNQ